MHSANYDVVIVGAGAAGLTAAIGLARAGFTVAVVEAGAFPGAENWSGCVYFAENLAHPEILGPEGVEALAWERRLVERGFFATDGQSLLGMTYRDPKAFRNCYTVLRPIYDQHLGQIAIGLGVALLNDTTAESLIRDKERMVGICTQRGPLYADLVFLAEGDASHLVTREGYERFTDPREAPKFLQGIKQVIEYSPGDIEKMFGVSAEEGVAYEILVRNGTLHGKPVHLNMGGFVYANRQSLSVGLVLPADNLNHHFDGDPNLLIEWFENLPALQPWLKDGRRGVFGAKIIRGGGARMYLPSSITAWPLAAPQVRSASIFPIRISPAPPQQWGCYWCRLPDASVKSEPGTHVKRCSGTTWSRYSEHTTGRTSNSCGGGLDTSSALDSFLMRRSTWRCVRRMCGLGRIDGSYRNGPIGSGWSATSLDRCAFR